jgi:uncharacterized membrane protein YeaQ/YmgE (transglycosylase-associated protein family)
MGIVLNVLVGFIGSFLGGLIANIFPIARLEIFSLWGFAFSLLGASLFLLFIHFLLRKR